MSWIIDKAATVYILVLIARWLIELLAPQYENTGWSVPRPELFCNGPAPVAIDGGLNTGLPYWLEDWPGSDTPSGRAPRGESLPGRGSVV